MTLDAPTYFGHLRAYVNDHYVMDDGSSGEVVLREKYFTPLPATRAKTRKVRLLLPGLGLAFQLDHDQFQLRKKKICWVRSLKKTIEHYTEDARKVRVRKFLFGDKADADSYLDPNRQLKADPSIRYYHFKEVQGQPLAALQNTSVQEI